jgi:HTH-type transcriptional regulator, competence development regulator
MISQLSSELKQLREIRGCSLRKVEVATGISNAYLSQLERGSAARPSPDKLARLASFYEVPYEQLMELAGYLGPSIDMSREHVSRTKLISSSKSKPAKVSVLREALMTTELSDEELGMVADYIAFVKNRRKRNSSI